MSFIEIDDKPVIFDDADYCEDNVYECSFIIEGHKCGFFGGNLKEGRKGRFGNQWLKRDECRTAWRKAKVQQSIPCRECKELRNINKHGAYVCPCPHCGDEVPF